MDFFNIILYKPLFNFLILLYNLIPGGDFGIAIILLTIIIRTLLVPLSISSIKSQKKIQEIQPKIKEIQIKYKNDKEKQAKELLEIYKSEKINPFGSIILLFIQLPILIALYSVFSKGLSASELINLYSFVNNPISINVMFLGVINLSRPNIIFAIIAGICQYFQTKMLLPKTNNMGNNPEFAKIMNFQMTYFLPIMTTVILFTLPSALGLYWIVGGLFSTAQQYFIFKNNKV